MACGNKFSIQSVPGLILIIATSIKDKYNKRFVILLITSHLNKRVELIPIILYALTVDDVQCNSGVVKGVVTHL
jgi:hypothetical protein